MKIISVGGSIIIPKTGFNIPFLKKFRSMILDQVKKGEKFVLVIGGGATARQYQEAGKSVIKMGNEELDWLGIHCTILNAQFVKHLFKNYTYNQVITDPRNRVKTNKPIIIASGWKPGCSTDKDAVLLAKAYGAKELINLSNIEYVYDKDPSKHKNAKKITKIDWKSFRRDIVGYKWEAGANKPFDPIASREAQKLGLSVKILKGTDLVQVKRVLRGESFKGTIVN